jgi:hypothetical protein
MKMINLGFMSVYIYCGTADNFTTGNPNRSNGRKVCPQCSKLIEWGEKRFPYGKTQLRIRETHLNRPARTVELEDREEDSYHA